MPQEISVHDNHLVAYTVLAKEKKIVLQTEFRDREPHEFTDVVFEEVLAYDFEGDLFGTIIFDVKEVDVAALLKEANRKGRRMWSVVNAHFCLRAQALKLRGNSARARGAGGRHRRPHAPTPSATPNVLYFGYRPPKNDLKIGRAIWSHILDSLK